MAVDQQRPLQKLVGTVQQPPAGHHSGVVDQDGDLPDLRPHPGRRLVDAPPLGQVHRVGVHQSAELPRQLGRVLVGRPVAVPQHQARSLFGELQSKEAAQGAPGPRDEDQLPVDALQPRPEESLDDGVQDGAGQADEHQQQVHDDDHGGPAPVPPVWTTRGRMDILYNLCVGLGQRRVGANRRALCGLWQAPHTWAQASEPEPALLVPSCLFSDWN